ncbi:MAG: spore germination protein [Bacillota bacterium]
MDWSKFITKINPLKKNKSKVYEMGDFKDLDLQARIDQTDKLKVARKLKKNLKIFCNVFGNSFDLNIRTFTVGENEIPGALVYMAGLSDNAEVENILKSLKIELLKIEQRKLSAEKMYNIINKKIINNRAINKMQDYSKIFSELTLGSTAVLLDGVPEAIICETRGFEVRNIEEPKNEITIRGPRDGFVENINVNTSLIRQRIRTPNLWFKEYKIGKLSKTSILITYIKGLASEELVEEVESRLKGIEVDQILESGFIQDYIQEQKYAIFPTILRSERPDKVCSSLTQGKVAILTANTPFVLIMPATFNMFLQSADDYYEPFIIINFIRILRHISYFMSFLIPGLYVGVVNYHPELLPANLLLRIAATREGVPFPLIVESLIMEATFELLREAGLRLPTAIGSAVTIVGALVVGEAAINAGLVSPPMVIIVALTAIASFTVPAYELGITGRFIRFVFLFLGGSMGLFGIQFGILALIIHLCSLRSFGQPFLQPFAPFIREDIQDSIFRFPFWRMINRPKLLDHRDKQRQKKGQEPSTPEEEEERK